MLPVDRAGLAGVVAMIEPWDEIEAAHRRRVLDWVGSDAALFRIRKPDDPPQHLVVYFVVTDPATGDLLLVDHIRAGLRLPAGGHCEPGELPWQTVRRECEEELSIVAAETAWLGQRPLFVTVTKTRDPRGDLGVHTDVTLWHVMQASPAGVVTFDEGEFSAMHWMTPRQVLDTPIAQLDPHMHRFTRKLLSSQPSRRGGER